MAIAMVLTLMAPGWIGTISGRSAGASILTGLAVEVMFVPALIILVIALTVSIIGIPLLAAIPFLLAAFGVLWIAGFTGVAVRIGRALRGRSAGMDASVGDFLIGFAIIIAITVLGQLLAVWPGLAESGDVADAIGGIAGRICGVDDRSWRCGDEPVHDAAYRAAARSRLIEVRTETSRFGPAR